MNCTRFGKDPKSVDVAELGNEVLTWEVTDSPAVQTCLD